LWNKTISAAEASCMYTNGVNPNAAGLKLYYDFNHGIANGNNAGVTTLVDRTNNKNGTVTSLALSGTSSNWVPGVAFPVHVSSSICLGDSVQFGGKSYKQSGTYFAVQPASSGCDSVSTLQLTVTAETVKQTASFCAGESYNFRSKVLTAPGTYYDTLKVSAACDTVFELKLSQKPSYVILGEVTICHGEGYLLGSTLLTEEGFYSETFSTSAGCDSTVNIDLDVDTVNVGVTDNGNSLIADAVQIENTYQWFDCNLKTIVNGETNRFFTKPATGAYAVIVTHVATGCVDTSACFGRVVGIKENRDRTPFILTPNPVNDITTLKLSKVYASVLVDIMDNEGKRVMEQREHNVAELKLDVEDLATGIYMVRIRADYIVTTLKLLKH
jgi:hypothetical protein